MPAISVAALAGCVLVHGLDHAHGSVPAPERGHVPGRDHGHGQVHAHGHAMATAFHPTGFDRPFTARAGARNPSGSGALREPETAERPPSAVRTGAPPLDRAGGRMCGRARLRFASALR
jgi:hypothetical protein